LVVVPGLGEMALRYYNRRYPIDVRVRATIKVCFADPSRYPQERYREAVEEAKARAEMPWAVSALARSTRGLAAAQFLHGRVGWATLREISAPTLVVWGDTDRLVAPDLAPYVAAAIPDSRLLVMSHIGHTAMMEDPETTARAVLGLVDDAAAVEADADSA
ncbi:MAG TPA: alpha/beta hydrolase, partial [Jatrophihabitans sp.]|nr:alpha/beta hydrolase [Jatrophihabitans sp.]